MAKNNSGKFFKGTLIGALIGAVAGILFAPQSGKETRDDIQKQAKKAADTANKKYGEVKHKAVEVETTVRAKGTQLLDKAKGAKQQAKRTPAGRKATSVTRKAANKTKTVAKKAARTTRSR